VTDHIEGVTRGKVGLLMSNLKGGFSHIEFMPNKDFTLPPLAQEPEEFIPAQEIR
jgi:hypothetical protein